MIFPFSLQGTAAVYSKKVEFLWQNVLKMLDLLASQKALEELEGGEKPKKCGKRGHQQHDFSDFSAVSADMSRSINMKNSDDFNMRDRKANLNFIIVTPRQLIEKEGREQKNVTINLYAKNGAKDLIGETSVQMKCREKHCMILSPFSRPQRGLPG